ncbi:hypothetical protein ACU686_40640 [Yinghuangia aomiensis]
MVNPRVLTACGIDQTCTAVSPSAWAWNAPDVPAQRRRHAGHGRG